MKQLILLVSLVFATLIGFSQPAVTQTFTNLNGIQNLNTNSGDVIYFSGNCSVQSGTLSSGATFVIETGANLSISGGMNFNGGSVYVEAGGNFISSQDLSNKQVSYINYGSITVSGNLELGSYTGGSCSSLTVSGVWETYNSLQGSGLIKTSGSNTSWHVFPLGATGSHFTIDFLDNNIVDADGANPNQFYPQDADVSTIATQEQVTISTATISTSPCSVTTPVSIMNFGFRSVGNVTTFTWTTTLESNVDHFLIQGYNIKDSTWDSVATCVSQYGSSGTGSVQKYYSITYTDPLIPAVQAAFGTLGIFLLMGIVMNVYFKKTRVIQFMSLSLVLLIVACSKSNEKIQVTQTETYKQFRLVEVDKDGTHFYYPQEVVPFD
jgi:hypothetical protein